MKTQVDPNDFVISRKRKKYRFALFANSRLCFELEDWQSDRPVDVVEIGAGTALFSVELAQRFPGKRYVAVDVKADRLQKGAQEAEARGLDNISFLRARADQLEGSFKPGSIQQVWLTFPDPFPRQRSAKHRLTHSKFLQLYKNLLSRSGQLLLKHDNPQFFSWSLEQLVADKWHLEELSFDLHDSNLSSDYKIMTTYEKRWISQGLVTNFVRANPEQ